jgi:hypothetical protein
VALALAAYPVAEAGRYSGPLALAGVIAVLFVAGALVTGWPAPVALALVVLVGEYAAALVARESDAVDSGAPVFGAGLLLLAELAYWSLDLRRAGREEGRAVVRRLTALAAAAGGSLLLAAFVVGVTAVPAGGGLLWDALGIAAVIATLAILARLARRGTA